MNQLWNQQREKTEGEINEFSNRKLSLWKSFAVLWNAVFTGCDKALCFIASVVTGLVIGVETAGVFFPTPIGYRVACILMTAGVWTIFWLLQKLLRHCLGHGLGWLMALGSSAGAIGFAVINGAGEGWTWRVVVTAGVFAVTLWLTTIAWWNMLRRVRMLTVLGTLVSSVAVLGLVWFLNMEGVPDESIAQYLALTQELPKKPLSTETEKYTVSVWEYEGETVNLTSYATRGSSLTAEYIASYLTYDLEKVPLRGRVWYPEEADDCPVLLIAHGNHDITTPSYLGYSYLGEYLAGCGYVVVSVDHNACNMLSDENDARAVLLLEHLKFILECNDCEGNTLYNKIDPNNIALAGHSRGGEAVATAYLFNRYDRYPENGTILFDYGFSIQSLIAIAPTVNQYQPAGHSVAIENVNYLLLHGASDQDVTEFEGMAQYENITFTDEGDYLKSALYIAGANHGQFNSLWGKYDRKGTAAAFLNTENLLSEADQQEIAKQFIRVFLDVTLKGDTRERTLLTDCEDYALPETVYVQCHQESGFVTIADFEEDANLNTATMEEANISVAGVRSWWEGTMDSSHAMRLAWNDAACITLETPTLDLTGTAVTFDLCDMDTAAVQRGDFALLDAEVCLEDTNGERASAQVRDFAVIYPVLCVRMDKLDDLFTTPSRKEAFATVSIPAEEFEEDETIDMTEITKIELRFSEGGKIALDNIGIIPV